MQCRRFWAISMVLLLAATFLPWFDIGSDVTPVRGIHLFLTFGLWVPLVGLVVAVVVHGYGSRKIGILLTALSDVAFAAMYVYLFANFQKILWTIFDTSMDTNWAYSLACATPFFWISVVLAVVTAILSLVSVLQKKK